MVESNGCLITLGRGGKETQFPIWEADVSFHTFIQLVKIFHLAPFVFDGQVSCPSFSIVRGIYFVSIY